MPPRRFAERKNIRVLVALFEWLDTQKTISVVEAMKEPI